MEKIKWCEAYCVQFPEIDQQQQKLVEMFNRVIEAKNKKTDSKILFDLLTELADFTRVNFSAEEKLLQRTKYPEYQQHRKDHRELLRRIISSRRLFGEDPDTVKSIDFSYMEDWLVNHTRKWDSRTAPFLRIHQYLDDCQSMKRGRSAT